MRESTEVLNRNGVSKNPVGSIAYCGVKIAVAGTAETVFVKSNLDMRRCGCITSPMKSTGIGSGQGIGMFIVFIT